MRFLKLIPLLAIGIVPMGCGFWDDPKPDSSSSSLELSSSSSSLSDTDRVEIDYADSLDLLDSAFHKVTAGEKWYIGHFPKGTVLHVQVLSPDLGTDAQLRFYNEFGTKQWPTEALPDSTYQDYATAGSQSALLNHIVLVDSGYFYMEWNDFGEDTIQAKINLKIDTAYYGFVGDADSLDLPIQKVLLGCFPLHGAEDSVHLHFSAKSGKSLTLTSQGSRIQDYRLWQKGISQPIATSTTGLRTQLLPQDSTQWQISLRTIIPAWNSGNYAFFQVQLTSIDLSQGEYFAKPDTLSTIGDTLDWSRQGTEFSGWDVRHDHYIYLGNLSSGKSMELYYSMQGIANPVRLLELLDSKGVPVDTLGNLLTWSWANLDPLVFSVPKDGKYFLHYKGTGGANTYWTDNTYTLGLKGLLRVPGSLTVWNYNPTEFDLNSGDTLEVAELLQKVSSLPLEVSDNYRIRLARSSRAILQDSVDIYMSSQGLPQPTSDRVFSGWLKAVDGQSGTAKLLIESVADPNHVDTCLLHILP